MTSQTSAPTTNPPCLLPCLSVWQILPSGTVSRNKPLSSLHCFFSGHLIIMTREWGTRYQATDRNELQQSREDRSWWRGPSWSMARRGLWWPDEPGLQSCQSQAGLCCGFDSELVSSGSPSCCFLGRFYFLFPSRMCWTWLWWFHISLDCLFASFIWGVDFSQYKSIPSSNLCSAIWDFNVFPYTPSFPFKYLRVESHQNPGETTRQRPEIQLSHAWGPGSHPNIPYNRAGWPTCEVPAPRR